MAKVTQPLLSGAASGKIGNTMVHFGWKGIAVVRKWVKPSNPMTAKQGVVRTVLGGLGASTKPVQTDSPFQIDALSITPSQQTYVSKYVQFMRATYLASSAEFISLHAEYAAHTAKSYFDSMAASKGLSDFAVSYDGLTDVFTAGMQLYCLAKYATVQHSINASVFNRAPYTTALASWTTTQVTALGADLNA
jgi:hypothetical protein